MTGTFWGGIRLIIYGCRNIPVKKFLIKENAQ